MGVGIVWSLGHGVASKKCTLWEDEGEAAKNRRDFRIRHIAVDVCLRPDPRIE